MVSHQSVAVTACLGIGLEPKGASPTRQGRYRGLICLQPVGLNKLPHLKEPQK